MKPNRPTGTALGFEATLWATADKLRGNLDAAEYKHVVLGLIFLRFSFHCDLHKDLKADYILANPPFNMSDWRSDKGAGKYEDIGGFCKSCTPDGIRTHGHVLTPGRCDGAADIEDDGEPFEQKMKRLTATLEEQFAESAKLEMAIKGNLRGLNHG